MSEVNNDNTPRFAGFDPFNLKEGETIYAQPRNEKDMEELREIAQEQMPYKDICAREKRGHQQCEDLCDPCLLRLKKELEEE